MGATSESFGRRTVLSAASIERADGRRTHSDLEDLLNWPSSLLRAGAIATAGFEIAYLFIERLSSPETIPRTIWLHVIAISICIAGFEMARTPRAAWRWRAQTLMFCGAIIAISARLAMLNGLYIFAATTALIIVLCTGAMLPWELPWQAALSVIGAGAISVLTRKIPGAERPFYWFAFAVAAFVSNAAVRLSSARRAEMMRQYEAIRRSHALLEGEIKARIELAIEREQIARTVERNEQTLRRIFDAITDLVFVTRLRDGWFVEANAAFAHSGFDRSHLERALSTDEFWLDPDARRDFRRRFDEAGSISNYEARLRRFNGAIGTFLLSAAPVEIGGEPCIVSIIRDVTALTEANEAIRRRAEDLTHILEANLDAVFVTRVSDGSILEANRPAMTLVGLPREEIIGRTAADLGLWKSTGANAEIAARLQIDRHVSNLPIDIQGKDGSTVSALVSLVVTEFRGEMCAIAFARDITEIKRTEDELRVAREDLSHQLETVRHSEEKFRRIFNVNTDAMSITDVQTGDFIDVNAEFVRSLGWSREELIGRNLRDFDMWAHLEQREQFTREVYREREVRNMEVTFRRKDGSEVICLLSGQTLKVDGRDRGIASARDITALKRTQAELIAAREAALAASRSKSEFLSSMSHEIRTPMTAILGMADLLGETDLTAEQRRFVASMTNNGNALLELINGILDLAKVESGRMMLEAVEFDPIDLVERVIEPLAIRAHGHGLEVCARFAPDMPRTMIGDPLRLRQILINLVGNAIKFTEAGEVVVDASVEQFADGRALLKVSVIDTGIGIAPDKIPILFDSFSQADSSTTRRYGGSGLGLAIVSRLVALMNGEVHVESVPGRGSRFSFSAGVATPTASQPAPDTRLSGMRILLADDNQTVRAELSAVLARAGAEVIDACGGAAAIAALRAEQAAGRTVDFALIDDRMPTMAGAETAAGIVAASNNPPRIAMMITTDDLATRIAHLRAAKIERWLVKPVKRAELVAIAAGARIGAVSAYRPPSIRRPPHPPGAPIDIDNGRALRILFADDSPDNRLLVTAFLRKLPFTVDTVEDGQLAIDRFKLARYDLVLMDIQMPVADGYTATRAIREWERARRVPRTPIIALSAAVLDESVRRAIEAGCDSHLAKPINKAALIAAIRAATAATDMKTEPVGASGANGVVDAGPIAD